MNINCLNNTINTPHTYHKNSNPVKKSSKADFCPNKYSAQDILAQYNKAVINFGQKFDLSMLEDEKSDDVFSPEELRSESGKFNIQSAFDLAYSYLKAEVAYLEKHGKLIPYKEREYLSECEYLGLSEEETKRYIEEKTNEFRERIKRLKQQTIDEIDKLSPTTDEHCVYRIDPLGYEPHQTEYFAKLVSFKEGQIVDLGQFPIYTSTSAKLVANTYGGGTNNDSVLFKIILPKGSKLIKMPTGDGIHQCIMKPDSQFEVVENKEFDDNFHYITLKYLP